MDEKLKKLKRNYNDLVVKHKWSEALIIVEQMLEIQPQSKIYCNQGRIFIKLKQYPKSIESLKKALSLDANNNDAKELLGKLTSSEKTLHDMESHSMADTLFAVPQQTSTSVTSINTKQFGRYQIIEKIGRGGMGEVYKAYDNKLDRVLALKIVSAIIESEESRQRFVMEAQATAKLNHPNIVGVHDIGEEDGRNFFTMDYIEGLALHRFINAQHSLQDIVRLMIDTCKGIHYAHEQGIIHRDLKPSNVMVDVSGNVRVMDFGLAKVMHSDAHLSRSGQQMGTPAYMSPEQANGYTVDIRTDVYALGATLYELLTGRPPFQGENSFNIIYQLHYKDPVSMRLLNPDIPKDLEAICLKCLEKSANARYDNVEQLQQDLQNFLDDIPVMAQPITPWKKSFKWMKRHKAVTGAGALAVMSLALVVILSIVYWQKAEKGKRRAILSVADLVLIRAKEQIEKHEFRQAGVLGGKALSLLQQYPQTTKNAQKTARDIVAAALRGNGLVWETRVIDKGQVPLVKIAGQTNSRFLPRSNVIAHSEQNNLIAAACNDGSIKFYDEFNGDLLFTIHDEKTPILSIIFHPNHKWIISGNWHGEIKIWDIYTRTLVKIIGRQSGAISSMEIYNNTLATGSWTIEDRLGELRLWDLETYSHKTLRYKGQPQSLQIYAGIADVSFHPNGKYLACAKGTNIIIWNIDSGKVISDNNAGFIPLTSVAYSGEGKYLAVSSWNYIIQLFRLDKTQQLLSKQKLLGHKGGVTRIVFGDKGRIMASASQDGSILLWDTDTWGIRSKFSGHGDYVQYVSLSDEKKLLSLSQNSILRMWEIQTDVLYSISLPDPTEITSMSFHPNGKKIAASTFTGKVFLIDVASKKIERQFSAHQQKITGLAFNSSGSQMATCSIGGKAYIWDTATGKQIEQLPLSPIYSNLFSVVFSPDDKKLVISLREQVAKVWDIKKRKFIADIPTDFICFYAAYTPDGSELALASQNIVFADAKTFEKKQQFNIHKNWISKVKFSRDGKTMASASGDSTLRIWDAKTRRQKHVFNYKSWVWDITFHPSNKFLACACTDNTIRIIDIESGVQTHKLFFQSKFKSGFVVAFNPVDGSLVSASDTLLFWNFTAKTSHITLPHWQKRTTLPLQRKFNFRTDISGASIEYSLHTEPLSVCKRLFSLDVDKNFVVSPFFAESEWRKPSITIDKEQYVYYLQQGKKAYKANDTSMAIDYFFIACCLAETKTLQFLQQQNIPLNRQLAYLFHKRAKKIGSFSQKIRYYNIAIRLYDNAQFYLERGIIFHMYHKNDKAKLDFSKACAKDPKLRKKLPQ
ncbi:serine/threonine-protein kinase [Candidatus Uabimicrobium amorphum]|uniref:non-specific serine/threonine protein kinase n=1 Tax=Uabimicrobium amorphum TaxID=2596890 RepID=A0A5S9F3K6_UABAM|nr:serine/threonine-protein kinase [Candidatus Uabimicrobium amorphum]BBM84786.1 protein kinase [Candidatus Uabimicrobium amorphum]